MLDSDEELVEVHVFVSGDVQGVGFRATAQRMARLVQVTGIVKNLDDGRVELLAQGLRGSLDEFLALLEQNPGMGHVSHMEVSIRPVTQKQEGFRILYL